MKTIEKIINPIIQTGSGNVLAICPTSTMLAYLEENNRIDICDILSNPTKENDGSKGKRQKPFNFKKMRKKFKKKRKDMIIGDITELTRYQKTFVRDSIYITKGTIYLFTQNSDYDYDLWVKRYKRFGVTTIIEHCEDGLVLTIEIGNTKNHFWKEKVYFILDVIFDFIDVIGDILAS